MANKRISPDYIKSLKKIGWAVLFFVSLGLVFNSVGKKENAAVKKINVNISPLSDGSKLVTEDDIEKTIELRFGVPLTALAVKEVNIERLERVLEEDPFIIDAEAYLDAQNRVTIDIVQREPILRVIDNNGLNYYLDKDGFKMPLSEHYSARVMVATGNLPPHVPSFLTRPQNYLREVFELTEILKADDFFKALIQQIHVSNRGELTLIPVVGRHKIYFGRYRDPEDKLERLKVYYQKILPNEGFRRHSSIDLRYKGQVVGKR
ncbi:MAG: cell division protein FtsQ/DivIB [Saprospiraceae bacterium]